MTTSHIITPSRVTECIVFSLTPYQALHSWSECPLHTVESNDINSTKPGKGEGWGVRSNKRLAFNEDFEYLTGRDVPSWGATSVIISIHLIWPLTRNIIWNSIKQMIRVKWFIAINYRINLSINYNFRCSKWVALLQSPAGSGVLQLVLLLTSHIPCPVKEFINQRNANQLKPKVASSAYWSLLEPSQELVWRCGENLTYHAG